jgi:hypothetical protein
METTRPSAPIAVFMPTALPVLAMPGLLPPLVAVELLAAVVEVEVLPPVRVRDPPQASFQLSMAELASVEADGSAATRQVMHD